MGHQDVSTEFLEMFWKKVHEFNVRLTGTYPEAGIGKLSAQDMILALKFWRGIRAVRTEIENGEAEEDTRLLTERILHAHRFDQRPLIALVATVELLPTKVWRRALWYYNIDFQSFESFLRRVTPEQIEGLRASLDAVLRDQVPPCFREGWKNVLRRIFRPSWAHPEHFKGESPEDCAHRYESKGAFAYEFFGIDFGHVLYRREEDECKIEGSLATRFLSKKHDRNDFVVNQEDGVYWWMYRTARSNYVWFPNRDVQLKQAICPGFWYTIFVWLLVLFVSPSASVLTGIEYAWDMSLWIVGFTGIVGCVTPLVISAILGKYMLIRIGRFIDWAAEQVGVIVDKEYWTVVGVTLAVIAVGSMGGALIYIVWCAMYSWFYESVVLATYMTAFLFLYVVHVLANAAESSLRSVVLPILSLPTALFVLGKVLFDIREVLWLAVLAIVSFFVGHWRYIALSVVVLAVVVVPFAVVFMLSKWEKRAWRGDKEASAMIVKFAFIGKVAVWLLVLVSAVGYGYVAVSLVSITTTGTVFVGVFLAVILWLLYAMIGNYQPEYINNTTRVLSEDMRHPYLVEADLKVLHAIGRNKWILSQEDYGVKVWWLLGFIQRHFSVNNFPGDLLGIDAKGFEVANEYHGFLLENDYRLDTKRRTEYVQCMLQGIPLRDAEKMIEAWRVRARESAEKWMHLYDVTIGRFVVYPFILVVRVIVKLVCDARTMWRVLNESCPYWMEPKRLDSSDC